MSIAITQSDLTVMEALADYRLLTVTQLALLTDRNENGLRRRLRSLRGLSLVDLLPGAMPASTGRPSDILGLSSKGMNLLQKQGALPKSLGFAQVDGKVLAPQAQHQILLNWCRVHLEYMTRKVPGLSLKCFAMNSPLATNASGHLIPSAEDGVAEVLDRQHTGFILPDAAFAISSVPKNKTLLFFLEIDMASEPIAPTRRNRPSIDKKSAAYQVYFRSGGYKKYEAIFDASFTGFRVLFVTHDQNRMASLCRSFFQIKPDFIWATTAERIFKHGISGRIWARGGNLKTAPESILGSLGQALPIPGQE